MKKLIAKDKKLRANFQKIEKHYFILKSIFKNTNFFALVRWKAYLKLKLLTLGNSKIAMSPKCPISLNKKKYNKLTFFSRYIFLKLIRSGVISGMKKASW